MKAGLLEVVLALQATFDFARSQDASAQAAIGIPATVTAGTSLADWALLYCDDLRRTGKFDLPIIESPGEFWGPPAVRDGMFEVADWTTTKSAFGDKALYIVSFTGTVYAFH